MRQLPGMRFVRETCICHEATLQTNANQALNRSAILCPTAMFSESRQGQVYRRVNTAPLAEFLSNTVCVFAFHCCHRLTLANPSDTLSISVPSVVVSSSP
jgi:hypothetical protein